MPGWLLGGHWLRLVQAISVWWPAPVWGWVAAWWSGALVGMLLGFEGTGPCASCPCGCVCLCGGCACGAGRGWFSCVDALVPALARAGRVSVGCVCCLRTG